MFLDFRHLCVAAMALVVSRPVLASEIRELTWQDLVPAKSSPALRIPGGAPPTGMGGGEWLSGGDAFDQGPEFPAATVGVVEDLDGTRVKLPGFIVPLELVDEGKVSEFLLVPYFGACIHYPPPPPNQVVYITLPKPAEIESMWEPVWVTGEIRTESRRSEMGHAGYSMAAEYIEEYE